MSVNDGNPASAQVFNQAFLSKISGGTTLGIITLNSSTSGAIVTNVQQKINDMIGDIAQNVADIIILDGRITTNDALIAANSAAIVQNANEIANFTPIFVGTTAEILAETREEGKLYYSTDEDLLYTDDGTQINKVIADLGEGYWFRETTTPIKTSGPIAELEITNLTVGNKYEVTVVAKCKRIVTQQDEVQLITFDNVPDEGDFTLEFDGQTTIIMGWDASAQEVEDALLALPNIDAAGVLVSGDFANGFLVEFTGTEGGIDQPLIAVTNNNLKFGGTGGTNEVQRIIFSDVPTGGSFTITFDGQTTSALPYNASAAQVEAALEALPNINGVTVTDI